MIDHNDMSFSHRNISWRQEGIITGQKGFSIVETLIGMALIGVIGIALLSGLGTVAKSTASNLNLTKGEALARSWMEYIQNQPYHTAGSGIYPAAYSAISLPSGFTLPLQSGKWLPALMPAATRLPATLVYRR